MKIVRGIVGFGAALLGNMLLVGAALLIGNHLFSWNPTKVSVEWQTTLTFAGMYALIGMVPAIFGATLLQHTGRLLTIAISGAAIIAAWAFLCILVARMNAGYLWLLFGVPALTLYVGVRGAQHIRARAA